MSTEHSTRHAYWQQHIQRFQSSGLSGSQYCAREALTYHCFIYWRRKLTADSDQPSGRGNELATRAPGDSSGFVTIQSASPATDTGLELSLPNGLIIGNIRDTNLSLVGQLLDQLS